MNVVDYNRNRFRAMFFCDDLIGDGIDTASKRITDVGGQIIDKKIYLPEDYMLTGYVSDAIRFLELEYNYEWV